MLDLAIKSENIITGEISRNGLVLLQAGCIVDVVAADVSVDCLVIDVQDRAVLPGVIDPHVHINEPGRTEWEGFNTATRAALSGGLTTLVDMPLNSSPVTTTVANFEQKLRATEGQLHTNCGFWGGIVPGNLSEVEGLIARGVLGFKAFLTHSGIDDFPNATEADLRQIMPILALHGLPLLVHCELSQENDTWKQHDKHSYQNYLASRPKSWEDEAIALMIRLCEETGCRTHIVHLSSADSLPQITAAKQRGLPLTVETGQHYLYFSAEDIADGQTQFKCAPPIRERANQEQLWEALQTGIIDFVATDHSPAPPRLKQIETGDFTTAWGGIASLQLALPVLWTAAHRRGASLPDLVRWLSTNPAKLIGLGHRKGKIEKGYDADLLVLDAENTFRVTESGLHHRHKVSPYVGLELRGVVEQTYLTGQLVYQRPDFLQFNQGKLLTR
ncbi:allantoinase [Hymenobacter gelipurpurascens]|uniref:allantoinase n=1 Tax=Hymenobacter gelipurpurascens TaxID=89968 RepID=A0A212TFD1_9BACT|nr:allantoinase AllB [Hymenobacter gelipurpurascens]SNC64713.1 allantoinase [Hymenobacter gelipurpurascens]